jgi:hypothetical protein
MAISGRDVVLNAAASASLAVLTGPFAPTGHAAVAAPA